MVNATEMIRPFKKNTHDFLRLSQTKSFMQVLDNQIQGKQLVSDSQVLKVSQGSSEFGGGTWMHEDVALEFATWLSPMFEIWVWEKVKELMKTGSTQAHDLTASLRHHRLTVTSFYSGG